LTARKKSRFVAVLGLERERLVEATGGDISEGCGLHIVETVAEKTERADAKYGKDCGAKSKRSPLAARRGNMLNCLLNWHAQYSAKVNKGWARIPRVGLPIFCYGPS
jgi:hypothetical protein